MLLFGTYIKSICFRHKLNYLFIVISIIGTYIVLAVTTIYIDNFLVLSLKGSYSNLRYTYISLRTIFIIGGISSIIYQYYNIVEADIRDYYILRALGATRKDIRILNMIQMVLLIVITIPMGIYSGYIITGHILKVMSDFTLDQSTLAFFDSSYTLLVTTIAACGLVIAIGIFLERGIRKNPLVNIFSNHFIGKEVS